MKTMCKWRLTAFYATTTVMAVIPFSCGQSILRLVTPVYLNDAVNALDAIVSFVAPLVLP